VIAPRPLRSPLDWLTKRLASGFSRFPHAASQPRGRFMWSGRDTYLSAACKTTYHTVDCLITPDFSAGRKVIYPREDLSSRYIPFLPFRYVPFLPAEKVMYLKISHLGTHPFCHIPFLPAEKLRTLVEISHPGIYPFCHSDTYLFCRQKKLCT